MSSTASVAAAPRVLPLPGAGDVVPEAEFPGCEPFHLPCEQLETYDGRFEYWDGRTQTAWKVAEPTTAAHELPTMGLAALAERIAAVRGAPIRCFGSMDLLVRDDVGEKRAIMQADQSLYLHPTRANLPTEALEVGWHDYPDVILEVDHTTDVRRGKLSLYEAWGFPEIWVVVPDRRARSRPSSRAAGLTVHVLEDGHYRARAESAAFPGWTAEELHAALNEATLTERTAAVLERVGSVLGERGGTAPDDDPLLRSQRRQAYDRGRESGWSEGRAAGRSEGRAEGQAEGRERERSLLYRLTARRFDPETARRLADLLRRRDDARLLARAGDLIIECATGAELLDRVGRCHTA